MGAYYWDVVVVIELGAYIHGVLTFNGCLLSRFYGIWRNGFQPVVNKYWWNLNWQLVIAKQKFHYVIRAYSCVEHR